MIMMDESTEKPLYKVKISTRKNNNHLLMQTKGYSGISSCGKYKFFIDEEVEDPDFWVVRNKHLRSKKTYLVAPENTILLTSEPRGIVNFPKRYRDQFALICTCEEKVKHRNKLITPAILPWFIGVMKEGDKSVPTKDYDKLKNTQFPEKTKLVSVITSKKAFTKGHQDRILFVKKLKQHYGDKIDIFGRGFKDFNDKWDVLAPYKYHIAIENSSAKYYWTEKISDCYLTGTFPIYYGCTNIEDYFPNKAYEKIDIHDFNKAIEVIDKAISENYYETRQHELLKAKELVLDDYNFFNIIAKCCDRMNPDLPKSHYTIKPAKTLLDWHNFYLYFIERNYYQVKSWILGLNRKDWAE